MTSEPGSIGSMPILAAIVGSRTIISLIWGGRAKLQALPV